MLYLRSRFVSIKNVGLLLIYRIRYFIRNASSRVASKEKRKENYARSR